MKLTVFPLAAALVLASLTATIAEDRPREISVTGTAEVAAAPDMAMVQIGVTHENTEASRAMAEAAEGANAILARLETLGVEARDMQTGQLSLSPLWTNPRSGEEARRITGFVARISVDVRVRDLDRLGPVLDAVVSDGANQLGGIRFAFEDPAPMLAEARAKAVADGRARAGQLAEAAGVVLGPLQSMSEYGGGGPQPLAMEASFARDAGIPIATGELSLSASVSMVYRIAD